jgi:hypothetical protein
VDDEGAELSWGLSASEAEPEDAAPSDEEPPELLMGEEPLLFSEFASFGKAQEKRMEATPSNVSNLTLFFTWLLYRKQKPPCRRGQQNFDD